MKKRKKVALNFEVDRLTNSIQNTIFGDSFQTEVSLVTKADLKQLTKKNGWSFNWKTEFDNNAKEVYKLTIIQTSFIETDHIFMNLVENAPFNIGKK